MGYALDAAAVEGNRVSVGTNAVHDPILAQASFDAALILCRAMKQPRDERDRSIRSELRTYGRNVANEVMRKRNQLLAKGWNPAQAAYDAMRLPIADFYAQEGMDVVQAAMAATYGADFGLSGAREIGCAITGGITAIGGGILSAFTGGGGGYAVGAGGSMVGDSMGCSTEARRTAQAIAEAQATAAQAMVDQARIQAEVEIRKEQEKSKRFTLALIIGGGAVILLTTGVMIVKA